MGSEGSCRSRVPRAGDDPLTATAVGPCGVCRRSRNPRRGWTSGMDRRLEEYVQLFFSWLFPVVRFALLLTALFYFISMPCLGRVNYFW